MSALSISIRNGTNFDAVAASDAVLRRIFNEVTSAARLADAAVYIKIDYEKLSMIRQLRLSNIEDLELSAILGGLLITEEHDGQTTPVSSGNEDGSHALACVEAMKSLNQAHNKKLYERAWKVLRQVIRSTGYVLPNFLEVENKSQNMLDDLGCVFYACMSDRHYHQNYVAQTHTSSENFCVNIVTFLNLVGGTPAAFDKAVGADSMPLEYFVFVIAHTIEQSKREMPQRLGQLTTNPRKGHWLWQVISDPSKIKGGLEDWVVLSEESYPQMIAQSKSVPVFLIHEVQLDIPQAIMAKANSIPPIWNRWESLEDPATIRPFFPLGIPPEYVPISGLEVNLPPPPTPHTAPISRPKHKYTLNDTVFASRPRTKDPKATPEERKANGKAKQQDKKINWARKHGGGGGGSAGAGAGMASGG